MSSEENLWVATKDKKSGRFYYYNKKTKQTTWKRPDGVKDPLLGTSLPRGSLNIKVWKEVADKRTKKVYYYNKGTRETRWEPPEQYIPIGEQIPMKHEQVLAKRRKKSTNGEVGEAKSVAKKPQVAAEKVEASADPEDDDSNWREAKDPKSGKSYYYNKITKRTVWKDPRKGAPPQENKAKNDGGGGGGGSESPKPVVVADASSPEPVAEPRQQVAVAAAAGGPKRDLKSLLEEGDEPEPAALTPVDPKPTVDPDENPNLQQKKSAFQRQASSIRRILEDSDDDDDHDDEDFHFLFAKHRKGLINRVMRKGHIMDNEEIMTFKKSLIKKALLKQNRHLDAQCVQTFKNVMSYMQDRKSSKDPTDHAVKLLRNVMSSPAGLRDEVYLQLCKQTNRNPNEGHALLGWQLLVLCLATFPPSKPLKKFLKAYFGENYKGQNTAMGAEKDKIKEYAEMCIQNLSKIMTLGQRKQPPSPIEVEQVSKLQGVSIRVYFLDETFKTLVIDSYTLVSDVQELLNQKLNLTCIEPFALFEHGNHKIHALNPKDRAVDVLSKWEFFPADQKAPDFTCFRFLYKAKLVLKTDNPQVMADPEAVNMLYLQSVYDITQARYPVKEENSLTILAALQLQATFGDFHAEMHGNGWIADKLSQFVPAKTFEFKNEDRRRIKISEWEQKILSKWEKIKGFGSLEAKLNYLDYVQDRKSYGVQYYWVQQRQFRDYPSPLLLGVTCEGSLLMHPESKEVLDYYPYTDIVTWGHSDEKFILVVGNVVQQRKLVFKTPEGAEMNSLIHDYVKYKVEVQAKK